MKKILIFIVVITILCSTGIWATTPGGSDDPIVVLSYLTQRISNLVKEYKLDTVPNMNTQISDLKKELSDVKNSSSGSSSLEIVEIKKGQQIICNSGTEIILRGGTAYAIASDQGGLSNVTQGKDIQDKGSIPTNNLIIIPRSDGRGVYTDDNAIFMVRGAYKVIE